MKCEVLHSIHEAVYEEIADADLIDFESLSPELTTIFDGIWNQRDLRCAQATY